jgi:hypothetical protein
MKTTRLGIAANGEDSAKLKKKKAGKAKPVEE